MEKQILCNELHGVQNIIDTTKYRYMSSQSLLLSLQEKKERKIHKCLLKIFILLSPFSFFLLLLCSH